MFAYIRIKGEWITQISAIRGCHFRSVFYNETVTYIIGRRESMNSRILKGEWEQLSGRLQDQWSKLTDSDLNDISGKYEELIAKLQSYYAYTKQEAENEFNDFYEQVSEKSGEYSNALINQGKHVDEMVRKSPWAVAGIAALTGIALGVFLSKL